MSEIPHHGPESQTESEESYEEDFESYCSDFEDYSDSHRSEQKDSDPVNIEQEVPENLEDRYNRQSSFGLEFGEEREKIKKLRICQKIAKRAKDLLQMIRFDMMTFELFNSPPDEGFQLIVKQGMKLNSTQTGSARRDFECQTDFVPNRTSWTQKPLNFSLTDSMEKIQREISGSGSEDFDSDRLKKTLGSYLRLSILKAANIVSRILEEKDERITTDDITESVIPNTKCSKIFQTDDQKLMVTFLQPSCDGTSFAAIFNGEDSSRAKIWKLHKGKSQTYDLKSKSQITSFAFMIEAPYFAVGGTPDGTLFIWDLKRTGSIFPAILVNLHQDPASHIDCIQLLKILSVTTVTITFLSMDISGYLAIWNVKRERSSMDLDSSFSKNIACRVARHETFQHLDNQINTTCADCYQQTLIFGTASGKVFRKALNSKEMPKLILKRSSKVESLLFVDEGKIVVKKTSIDNISSRGRRRHQFKGERYCNGSNTV
ncbi:uncharacterized protein LOC136041999 isoform X2 [Artemia franciscana]|uniref:uncharacterized protein LOC136041999 isoform X2 n=1 Tax=Artemia franciscana TaxID=6661 RepID=UPI0032DB87B9